MLHHSTDPISGCWGKWNTRLTGRFLQHLGDERYYLEGEIGTLGTSSWQIEIG